MAAAILDERKPPSITFLAISNQYANLFFLILFTKWLPAAILDDRKSLSIAFLAISDQCATLIFVNFFTKWLSADILDDRKPPSITFLAISNQYATFFFDFVHKIAAGGHFGWPKITFDRISRHFRSIRNFWFFFSQNGCRRPFWMTENHFWSHFSPFQINTQNLIFFSQNGCRRPFWMTENHFRSDFSPFQINTQLRFFFPKWLPAAILDDQKSLLNAFLAISDQYATFF